MKKVSKKRAAGEETRAKILDAAEQIFSEKGFSSTSTREIARLAGMDKYAIYYHFKNKETLYRAVIERSFSKMTAFIDELFPPKILTGKGLEKIFESIFDYMARNSAIMRIMQRESLDCTNTDISDIFRQYFKPLFRKGVRFSEMGKESGTFRKDLNSRQFVISLYTMIMSYYNDGVMISMLLGEDALSRKMIRERKSQLARFVTDNLSPAVP